MPVRVKKVGGKFRVVESRTGRVAKRGGKAVDGGGKSRARAVEQVQAINLSERRRAGKSAPPAPRRKRR